MAIITRSEAAPEGNLTFTVGATDFALTGDTPYTTFDPNIIEYATANPHLLHVEVPPVTGVDTAVEQDQSDPHINPSVDIFSNQASQEAKDAAALFQGATFAAAGVSQAAPGEKLTVAEWRDSKLTELGVEVEAAPATPAAEPAKPAAPTTTSSDSGSSSAQESTITGASN